MDNEALTNLEAILAPWYDLDTLEPLFGLDPFPSELAQYETLKRGQAEGTDLQPAEK